MANDNDTGKIKQNDQIVKHNKNKELSECWDKRPGRITLKMLIHVKQDSRY